MHKFLSDSRVLHHREDVAEAGSGLICGLISTSWRSRFSLPQHGCQLVGSLLFLLLLVLAWAPVQAADYRFPGNLPAGTTGGGGSYSIGALSLNAGDTITVTSPTVLTIQGAFTAGAGVIINAAGVASDLKLVVEGTTDVGANSNISANLAGVGVVTLGDGGSFTGNIKTESAAVNIGGNSTVNGSIASTVAGVVNVGPDSRVTGSINTLSGAVNVGAHSRVDGSIFSALAGVVNLGAGATVGGNNTTTSGAVNIGAGGKVVGFLLDTVAGAMTLGDSVTIGSGISTQAGAITIGPNSTVGTSVCTGIAGAITTNENVRVGGNITSNEGAITIGGQNTVGGIVRAVIGAVTIDSSSKLGK
ncbi:MAG: hypothetical protein H7232_14340, partial [Aeromicrobium sp.]|nr:hypothetical protein [Burkholderiales bacterium]